MKQLRSKRQARLRSRQLSAEARPPACLEALGSPAPPSYLPTQSEDPPESRILLVQRQHLHLPWHPPGESITRYRRFTTHGKLLRD